MTYYISRFFSSVAPKKKKKKLMQIFNSNLKSSEKKSRTFHIKKG
jgi:S-adenosylmethionine hydrolase